MKKLLLKVYPENTFEKLEFNQIIDGASSFCLGNLGEIIIRENKPSIHLENIQKELSLCMEVKSSLSEGYNFPISNYFDIEKELTLLNKDGYVLPLEALQNIFGIAQMYNSVMLEFSDEKRENLPLLSSLFTQFDSTIEIVKLFAKIFTPDFQVKDNASSELASIRKILKRKLKEIDSAFSKAIKYYVGKGYLKDTIESYRNGRRVLSVKVEHKRHVKGVIHDDSATGKTVFIEPQQVLQLNYDLYDLQLEERNEIRKILSKLCGDLQPYALDLDLVLKIVAKYDSIQAKVRFTNKFNGIQPVVKQGPQLKIINGLHPLLHIKNKALEEPTIAFNVQFSKGNNILVISGPNAGGKSVTLKSIGLLQLMVQSGYLIPVNETSVFGIYDKLFSDIGDQQSIEKDLSTYSSRLINHKKILLHSTENSMVLIDEFGSGTDPQIGGAIAEAILSRLLEKKCFGVITTHYSNLKIFAHKTKGVINGAMSFDKDTLMPTFQLLVGKPGSSYAYEIAERIGLPKRIIKYAQKTTGNNVKEVEEVLTDLRSNLQSSTKKIEEVEAKEKQLDQMIKVYQGLFNEMELKRKRLKATQNENHLAEINKLKYELKEVIKKSEKNLKLKEAEGLKAKLDKQFTVVSKKLDLTKTDLSQDVERVNPKVGDYVQIVNGGAKGHVIEIKKDKAVVEMGMMKMEIPLYGLDIIKEPLKNIYKKNISIKLTNATSLQSSKLDIRGMMPMEAIGVLDDFFDNNLLSDNTMLEIIHGKGTGVLRKLVKQKINEFKLDAKVYHPTPKGGGNGKTIIEFR